MLVFSDFQTAGAGTIACAWGHYSKSTFAIFDFGRNPIEERPVVIGFPMHFRKT
jgi:hypothetical protein